MKTSRALLFFLIFIASLYGVLSMLGVGSLSRLLVIAGVIVVVYLIGSGTPRST
jgi:hypothetical protein